MQISPKLAMLIKVVLTLANAVANGTLVLTGVTDVHTATLIAAGCQVLVTATSVLTDAFSSSKPGPLAAPDPPVLTAAKPWPNFQQALRQPRSKVQKRQPYGRSTITYHEVPRVAA
jgi:hypothetical protein